MQSANSLLSYHGHNGSRINLFYTVYWEHHLPVAVLVHVPVALIPIKQLTHDISQYMVYNIIGQTLHFNILLQPGCTNVMYRHYDLYLAQYQDWWFNKVDTDSVLLTNCHGGLRL